MKRWIIFLLLTIFGTISCVGSDIPKTYSYNNYDNYTNISPYAHAPVREIPIWIDKNFASDDVFAIKESINQWNHVLNNYVVLTVVDEKFDMEISKIKKQTVANGWLVMNIQSDNPIIPGQKDPKLRTVAFCDTIGGHHIYLITDRIVKKDFMGITLHEMAHLLGAVHYDENKLMHAQYSGFACVDADTVKMVAAALKIPFSGLNYCAENKEPFKPINY